LLGLGLRLGLGLGLELGFGLGLEIGLGLGLHLFVKVPRAGDSEVTFSEFESFRSSIGLRWG